MKMGFKSEIFSIKSREEFLGLALEIFRFQHAENAVYRSFCDLLNISPSEVNQLEDIPFLPIEFFRSHKVVTSNKATELCFKSSGTTASNRSSHHITDASVYTQSFESGFERKYGAIKGYVILALLPNYLERQDSSLVYMMDHLIKLTANRQSGFFLDEYEELKTRLLEADASNKKVLLFGIPFALLHLLKNQRFSLKNSIIMETGGMKGMQRELVREELHHQLCHGFGVDSIHSEYGMTELLSQAYSEGNGNFETPPWMKVFIRDPEDPLSLIGDNRSGGINIIDLANYNSCSFIATQDLGKLHADGTFEVLGRFDHADIRGCNLMAL